MRASGEWDTHSSRSQQAVGAVSRLARDLIGPIPDDLPTVEGIFQALDPEQSRILACVLADRIRAAIALRLGDGASAAVVLIDMAGNWLGDAGDLTPWK